MSVGVEFSLVMQTYECRWRKKTKQNFVRFRLQSAHVNFHVAYRKIALRIEETMECQVFSRKQIKPISVIQEYVLQIQKFRGQFYKSFTLEIYKCSYCFQQGRQ